MRINIGDKLKHQRSISGWLVMITVLFMSMTSLAETIITDGETGLPLSKASIFDKNGVFIAVADEKGRIPENLSPSSYPLNIRYVGFEPITVMNPNSGNVSMTESTYTLPEVVIDDVSRNILYIQAYVRGYETLDNSKDTIAFFREQVVDYAIPIGKAKYKGWKKPRVLAQKEYEYLKVDKKDVQKDTLIYKENGKFLTTNFDIAQKFKFPAEILSGDTAEYVKQGKYYPAEKWAVLGDSYIYEKDELANHQDHVFQPSFLKLLGASAAQTMDESRYKFEKGTKSQINVENLVEASNNWNMILKGKLFKKASEQNEDTKMAFFSEMFVIDRAYLTADEAKELKKDAPVVDIRNFKVPEGIPAPPEEVVKLKNAVIESNFNTKK